MIEVVGFYFSYTSVVGIIYIHIIITIGTSELLILFILDISNDFQNTIIPKSEERVLLVYHISTLNGLKENEQNIH